MVVAIMGLFLFLSVPTALRFYQNREVEETAQLLGTTLQRAREYSLAARNDASYGVKLFSASSSFVLFQGSSYASRYSPEDENITYPSNLIVSGTSTEIVFSRLYGTSTMSGYWTVANDGSEIRISVSTSGLVEIQ